MPEREHEELRFAGVVLFGIAAAALMASDRLLYVVSWLTALGR